MPEYATVVPVPSEEPQNIYYPSSTRSKLIHEDSRMAQKAYDYDVCGKLAKSYGCSNHPSIEVVKRIPQTCKQRFTTCCEPRVFNQRMEKHEPIIEMMMEVQPNHWDGEFPTQISSITIRKPNVQGDAALAVAQAARDVLKKLAQDGEYKPDAQSENYFVKVALKGFENGEVVIKAIYWGPHYAPSKIRSALIERIRPDAKVEVTTEPNRNAEGLFADLFHIIVPKDEAAQAELEITFHGKDLLFYSQNLDYEAMCEHGSFPCSDTQGNELENSIVNSDGYTYEIVPNCPKCGKPADVISENHPLSATVDEVAKGKWQKVPIKRRRH